VKKKPAQISINLLPKDPFFESILGRVLQWALSGGRYVVIFTELVVIISFAARFTLDRQVTDLNQALHQKESIIDSYGELEANFTAAQTKITSYNQLAQENNSTEVFTHLQAVTPDGISLSGLSIRPTSVTIAGNTLSQSAFNIFINNLQLSTNFHNVSVDRVESADRNTPGLSFRIRADTKVAPSVRQQRR
jgi:Tfp pilus assembly protein PilN